MGPDITTAAGVTTALEFYRPYYRPIYYYPAP
jgi:hypothetical protein